MRNTTDTQLLDIARLTLSYLLEYGITEKDIRELREELGPISPSLLAEAKRRAKEKAK